MESNSSSSSNRRKRTGEEVEAKEKAKVLKVGISSGNNNNNGSGGIPTILSDPALLDCNGEVTGMENNSRSSSNKRKRTGEEVEAKAKVLKVGVSSGNNNDNGNGGIPVLLSDPSLLDCNICLKPLSPPVFQCQDGHIACNMCCHKNNYKCSRCVHPIGTIRCPIIEKLVETIKLPCRYSQLGCKEMPSYCQKSTHEKNCFHSPCHCPFSQCNFVGSSEQLSQHFKDNHSSERMEFSFGKPFSVRVKLYEPFVALQSSDGPVFLLNNFSIITSNSFTIVSLSNNNPEVKNLYRLTLKNGDDILTFSSRAKVTNRKNESSTLNCCSLTFAARFTHSVLGQFELEITIYPE